MNENVKNWKSEEKKEKDFDFERNKKFAEGFIANTKKPELAHLMQPGVSIHMGMTTDNEATHVLICFVPGMNRKIGNYAWPVYFNQSYEKFKSEFKKIFDNYQAYAKR